MLKDDDVELLTDSEVEECRDEIVKRREVI